MILLFNIVLEGPNQYIEMKKILRIIQTGKEEVELSLLVDDISMYKETPKKLTKKLLGLVYY